MPLAELLKRYPGPPYVSSKTLDRHTSALSELFKWARRQGLIEGENPASDQMRRCGDATWLPFATEELQKLFVGAVFDVRPKQHSLATVLPWIMAIGLYLGMRLVESLPVTIFELSKE